MYPLQNIAMRDYQESVTTGRTDRQDAGQSDPYVPLKLLRRRHKKDPKPDRDPLSTGRTNE